MVTLKMSHIIKITCATLLLCLSVSAVQAETRVTLSRQNISMNESVDLIVSSDSSADIDDIIIKQLSKDFEISNQGRSSETSCVNFKCNSSNKTTYRLSPKHAGVFNIPAMSINGTTTNPLKLTVREVNSDPDKGMVDPVFVELSIDRTDVKVQQQVILKLRINDSINISNIQLEPFNIPDATLKELTNTNYQRNIGDTTYTTYEITYALFPQKSEPLIIGPITVIGLIPDGRQQGFSSFFNRGRKVSFRSNAVTLNVDPAPKNITGDWLPAQLLTMKDSWLSDLDNVKVGDSITREIQVSALGLTAEQLPNITVNGDSHFKAYQEQPKLENRQNEMGIIGILTEKIAIVPNASGNIQIPAIKITWWDINTQSLKTAKIPGKTIEVHINPELNKQLPNMPIVGTQDVQKPITEKSEPLTEQASAKTTHLIVWRIIAITSIALNLLLLALYLKKRKYPEIQDNNNQEEQEADGYHLIEQACHSKRPNDIRIALLKWAKDTWSDKQIYSLTDIARMINTPSFHEWASKIDAAIYNKENIEVDFDDICQEIEKFNQTRQKNTLGQLYPTN